MRGRGTNEMNKEKKKGMKGGWFEDAVCGVRGGGGGVVCVS